MPRRRDKTDESTSGGRKIKRKGISLLPSDHEMFEPIRRKYLSKALKTEGAPSTLGDNEIVRAGLIALLKVIPDGQLVDIVMTMQRSKRGRPTDESKQGDT